VGLATAYDLAVVEPALAVVAGLAMLAIGLYGIRDFRRWNSRRTDPVTARVFTAMLLGVTMFPALVLLGGLLAVSTLAQPIAR
jgi:hypothetical protein